jgi:WD40 repeat protein
MHALIPSPPRRPISAKVGRATPWWHGRRRPEGTGARQIAQVAVAFVGISLLLGLPTGALATFPGANGRLLFGYEWGDPFCEPDLGVPCGGWSWRAVSPAGRAAVGLERRVSRLCVEGCAGVSSAPSGRRFALVDASARILLVSGGGRLVRRIDTGLAEPDRATRLAWSPDERRIAFVSKGQPPALRPAVIYTVGTDGRGLRRLGPGDAPEWSRANLIAFARKDGLYVMRSDGTGTRRIKRVRRYMRRWEICLTCATSWSPGGRLLAYTNRNGDMAVMTAAGRHVRRLTGDGTAWFPAWSPDGREIAFARESRAGESVRIVPARGGPERELGSFDALARTVRVVRGLTSLDWQPVRTRDSTGRTG